MQNLSIKLRFTGVSRLLCHNGQLADTLNSYARELKKVTSKKKKVDADYEEMARIEFYGGLYLDEKDGPVLPGEMIEACLIAGAKKSKSGMEAKSSIWVDQTPILYDGPRSKEKLQKDPNFNFRALVRVGMQRVARVRPVFAKWSIEPTIAYSDVMTEPAKIIEWATAAGQQVGLGDWRPRFGRFTVEAI